MVSPTVLGEGLGEVLGAFTCTRLENPLEGAPGTLMLQRHGESIWNRENRFAGWTDVDLSERGRRRW